MPLKEWPFAPPALKYWTHDERLLDVVSEDDHDLVTPHTRPNLSQIKQQARPRRTRGSLADVESDDPPATRAARRSARIAGSQLSVRRAPIQPSPNLDPIPRIDSADKPAKYKPWIDLPSVRAEFRTYLRSEEKFEVMRAENASLGIKTSISPPEYPWYGPWSTMLSKMFPSEELYAIQSQSCINSKADFVCITDAEKVEHQVPDRAAAAKVKLQERMTWSALKARRSKTMLDQVNSILSVDGLGDEDIDLADLNGRADYITWLLILNAHVPVAIVEIKPLWALQYLHARIDAQQQIFRRVRALAILCQRNPAMADWITSPFYAISAFGNRFCVYEVSFGDLSNIWIKPQIFHPSPNYVPKDSDLPAEQWSTEVCGFLGECVLRGIHETVKRFFDAKFPMDKREPLDGDSDESADEDEETFMKQQMQQPVCEPIYTEDQPANQAGTESSALESTDEGSEFVPTDTGFDNSD